jgi:hypothetical protein
MKTEITKIKLQLKDKVIELSAQEARDIQAELNKLFEIATPVKVVTKEIHHHHIKSPIYVDRFVPSWPHRWDIRCGTSSSTPDVLCMSVGQLS